MQGRSKNCQDAVHVSIKQAVPGPGHYGCGIEMNSTGTYSVSNFQNSRAAYWSPSKERFLDETKSTRNLPGPGEYTINEKKDGVYILSKYKNNGTSKFHKSVQPRSTKAKLFDTPGPGSYIAQSDFGHFDNMKIKVPGSTKNSYRMRLSLRGSTPASTAALELRNSQSYNKLNRRKT